MNLTGSSVGNSISGNNGANVLTGLGGNDSLNGLGGNDTLVGGLGRDVMVGGAGRDIFDFNAIAESVVGANRDTVVFSRADLDRIDLSTIDANAAVAGNQAFRFVAGNFTGAGQLHYIAATGILEGNTGGSLAADFQIKVNGVTSMLATDFFL
jgi:Ca2+-binding RTX toxin-like protein